MSEPVYPKNLRAKLRLEAAAPDLLAALQLARDFCWARGASDAIMNLIHAAIAKATGEDRCTCRLHPGDTVLRHSHICPIAPATGKQAKE